MPTHKTFSGPLTLIRSLWCLEGQMVVVGIGAPGLTPLSVAGWLALGYDALLLCNTHSPVHIHGAQQHQMNFWHNLWHTDSTAASGTSVVHIREQHRSHLSLQIGGLTQDCSNSSALAMKLLQSCAKISKGLSNIWLGTAMNTMLDLFSSK